MSLQLKKSEQLGKETAESGLLFIMKSVEEVSRSAEEM